MKLWPLILLLPSCGTYYVGRKPVDLDEELMAQRPVVVQQPATVEAAAVPPAIAPEKAEPEVEEEPAPLIGWDGREVEASDRPLHGVDTGEGGHSSMLSMYMDARTQVEHLKLEVSSINEMLAKQNEIIAGHDAVLAGKEAEIQRLQLDLMTSEAARADLEDRLITAQIRRLEAEKQLLLKLLGVEEKAEEKPSDVVASQEP